MKKIQKVSRTHIRFGVCASVLSILCAMPSFGATNSQITRLLQQKKQKMAQLEQCAQKVKGFKIAGISTLGLTAVGVGGNIALASKNKQLDKEINDVDNGLKAKIGKEQEKLEKIQADIAAEEKKKTEEDVAKKEQEKLNNCQGDLWELFVEKCPNCTVLTKADVCDYDLNLAAGADGWLVDNSKKIIGFFGVSSKDSGTMQFTFKGCDCETLATSEKPEEKNENVAKEEYEGVVGKECTDTTKKLLHVKKGTYIEIKRNTRKCLKEATQNVVPCECSATECIDDYEVVGGLCKKKSASGSETLEAYKHLVVVEEKTNTATGEAQTEWKYTVESAKQQAEKFNEAASAFLKKSYKNYNELNSEKLKVKKYKQEFDSNVKALDDMYSMLTREYQNKIIVDYHEILKLQEKIEDVYKKLDQKKPGAL